jgi:hypothetical protein
MPTNWAVRVTRRTRRRRTNRATTMTMTGSFMFHDKTKVGHRVAKTWIRTRRLFVLPYSLAT